MKRCKRTKLIPLSHIAQLDSDEAGRGGCYELPQRRKVIKQRTFRYRKRETNKPTVTVAPFETKAGSFVQNHGRRVKATNHSTGSSSSGFRLRKSAPTLSLTRMARNKKRYACGCNWRLAIGRSCPVKCPCRSTAPIQCIVQQSIG